MTSSATCPGRKRPCGPGIAWISTNSPENTKDVAVNPFPKAASDSAPFSAECHAYSFLIQSQNNAAMSITPSRQCIRLASLYAGEFREAILSIAELAAGMDWDEARVNALDALKRSRL